MKVLSVSDVVDPLVYTKSLPERFGDVDLVISSGDLPYYYLEFIVTMLHVPLFFVRGNHAPMKKPWEREHPLPQGCVNLDQRVLNHRGLLIAGLEGSMKYSDRGIAQYTEGEMRLKVARLIPHLLWNKLREGRYLDVLVTHAPPFGIHDKPDRCHTGFKVFNWFIETFRPQYLIHGHVHLSGYHRPEDVLVKVGDTWVLNTYGHRVTEISPKGREA